MKREQELSKEHEKALQDKKQELKSIVNQLYTIQASYDQLRLDRKEETAYSESQIDEYKQKLH